MDAVLPLKAPAGVAEVKHERVESAPVREGVRADLAPAKTVTAAEGTTASRNYSREWLVDPQSRDLIYRVVDERSRRVVRQVPDQALLRLRAYTRTLNMRDEDGQPPSQRKA